MNLRPAITTWLPSYRGRGSSQTLSRGPRSAGVLIPSALSYAAIVGVEPMIALSLIVGLIVFLFRLLKMGWIADLVPDPVLKGSSKGSCGFLDRFDRVQRRARPARRQGDGRPSTE